MGAQNQFGTTSDMVIQEIDDHGTRRLLAIDDKGLYLTSPQKVDQPLADINRYGVNRTEFTTRLAELGHAPDELFEKYKYMIREGQTQQTEKRKLNPIKASKRG